MKIDPRHLEQIAAIVKHGTLHEAARQLGTSQPALSRMIAHLEERVGTKLFERNSRPLVPTEICKTFAKHGRSVAAIRQRASEDLRLDRSGMTGELRIGAPPFFCERLVGDTIAAFINERPGTNLKLTAAYFPELEQRLLNNQIDLVICPLRLLTVSKQDLSVEPLYVDKHIVVGRKTHPLAQKADISTEDLEAAMWISHSEKSMLRIDMEAALASIGVRNLNIAFQSGSAGAIFEMLRHTDTLTILPSYAISKIESETDLCALPVELRTPPMTVGIVTLRNHTKSRLQSAFEALLNTQALGESGQP